jgi:putative transposase
LWEGRFRSCLTQTEDYVLACYRYIELNPVRAAMVNRPQDNRWSSDHVNAQGKADRLITPHAEDTRLARDDNDRREAYRALFEAPLRRRP